MYCSKILLYFLSIFWFLIPERRALNFNLTNIGPQNQNVNITVFSDAFISSQGLELTSNIYSQGESGTGKATYIELLHLWDQSSRNLTDFETHFVFVVDSEGQTDFADGITFFLAPNGSYNSSSIYSGGSIGLPIHDGILTSPFVAVEFDTFQNPGLDPMGINPVTHVGIDVNSLTSSATAIWYCNVTHGIENEAWIRYDSNSHNLSVAFTGSTNTTRVEDTINLIIDLREYLPEWVTFGFSASTGWKFERNTVKSWEFRSSLDVTNPEKPGSNKIFPVAMVGLVVGSCVLVGGFVLVGFCFRKRSRAKEDDQFEIEMSLENEFKSSAGPKKFSYDLLSRATNNFEEEQKLGEGGFGGVYRGFLGVSNSYIAIKRISRGSKQGIKEYATEVRIISRLRHRNLVQLIGWCHEKKELLLVYEFMENASLDFHLFQGKSLLTWGTRYKIAQDLASGLLYLHEEWEQCVVHRDIKSSNVMLDSNFNAKLGDFGLARFVDHAKGSQTTVLAGTIGYMAPECVVTGNASKKSDVYSFGVVALEIACGIKPSDMKGPDCQMGMVEWVWDLYGMGRLLEAVDEKLGMDFDEQELERLMIVGLWCTQRDPNLRPNIRQTIHVLGFQAPLPILPKRSLSFSFSPPPVDISSTTSNTSQYQCSS